MDAIVPQQEESGTSQRPGKVFNVKPLYDRTVEFVGSHSNLYVDALHLLPVRNLTDILLISYEKKESKTLQQILWDHVLFEKLLRNSVDWKIIHKCITLINECEAKFSFHMAKAKIEYYEQIKHGVLQGYFKGPEITQFIFNIIRIGTFYTECAMYEIAKKIYLCADVLDCSSFVNEQHLEISFELIVRMAYVLTLDSQFEEADSMIIKANRLADIFPEQKPNIAMLLTTSSIYMFTLSQYNKSYEFALQAVQQLHFNLDPKIIIDTLRQACKACIIKRLFKHAYNFIKEAMKLTKFFFGVDHPKFAESLSDYGFLLLSVDSVENSVKFYKEALKIQQELFGEQNILTATTHEDLAYAMYVNEYNRGDFHEAQKHAESAQINLMELLPSDHLLLSSSKRVQALIMEEMAIDLEGNQVQQTLLDYAEKLHLDSLNITIRKFGENNLQTAKHLGNLGRLYQSMKRYSEAETKHLKAIEIKEKLLGTEDYEVSLSLGHLASLYNYDMEKYEAAEQLYLRSIKIGCKLFGEWYSGLEYDYRGLIHLYEMNRRHTEQIHYELLLSDWIARREGTNSHLISNETIDLDSEVCLKTSLNVLKYSTCIETSKGSKHSSGVT